MTAYLSASISKLGSLLWKQKFAILGALIVICTYTVNEGLLEREKDFEAKMDAMNASSENLDHYESVMERFDRLDSEIASAPDKEKADQKLPYFRSTQYVMTWKLFDILAVLEKSKGLLELLPRGKVFDDLTRESQASTTKYERVWKAVGSPDSTERGTEQQILTLKMEIRNFEAHVFRAASNARKRHESRAGIYKAFSVMLYLVGWSLNFRGRLFGESDTAE